MVAVVIVVIVFVVIVVVIVVANQDEEVKNSNDGHDRGSDSCDNDFEDGNTIYTIIPCLIF